MRYLKKYNELHTNTDSSSNSPKKWSIIDICTMCEDILLDLTDEGFESKITVNNWDYDFYPFRKVSRIYDDNLKWISVKVTREAPKGIQLGTDVENTSMDFMNHVKPVINRLKSFLESEGLIFVQESNVHELAGNDLGYYVSYQIPQSKSTAKVSGADPTNRNR